MTNYPLTTFYVKNNTDQTVNFKATVVKQSSMGPFERTVPFTVPARDSVLARQTNFHSDAEPNQWFTDFTLFPIEGVFFNDPNKPESWIKSTDAKGRPVYTFTVGK
jgi:hypothetical protein